MEKAVRFVRTLVKEVMKDDMFSLANELTYKLLLAIFPFVIFLMTIIGFLQIKLDTSALLAQASYTLPMQVTEILGVFLKEISTDTSVPLLSGSLLVSIWSSSSGFNAVIRGINKAYGQKETRGFIRVRAISVGLVFLFAVGLILSLLLLIYSKSIITFLAKYWEFPFHSIALANYIGSIILIVLLLIMTMVIYKVASCKRISFTSVLPGACVTVFFWLLASKLYSVYVNNFSKHSAVYGSIGSVFILMIWLNLISALLLLGSEINALLRVE